MGDAATTNSPDTMVRRRVTPLSSTHEVQDPTTTTNKTSVDASSSGEDDGPGQKSLLPPAKWTFNKDGVPQAVAHRGYKAEFPENTMGAFRGAVNVGAQAIETDVHLSKDDVVVIAHDPSLKRCYGVDGLVRDHDWAYLSTLRTLRSPRQPMPRLSDLLSYLAEPGNESVWLLLDIKVDDPAEVLLSRIADTLALADAGHGPHNPWTARVVLGCWTARHLRLCRDLLPSFAAAWIGASLPLAREFLRVPHLAMNVRQEPLRAAPAGPRFVAECRARGRPVYAWTVNDAGWMRWAVRRGLDAVITDDPKRYLEVAEEYKRGKEGEQRAGGDGVVARIREGVLSMLVLPVVLQLASWLLGKKYYKRVGTPAESREVLKGLAEA